MYVRDFEKEKLPDLEKTAGAEVAQPL